MPSSNANRDFLPFQKWYDDTNDATVLKRVSESAGFCPGESDPEGNCLEQTFFPCTVWRTFSISGFFTRIDSWMCAVTLGTDMSKLSGDSEEMYTKKKIINQSKISAEVKWNATIRKSFMLPARLDVLSSLRE